MRLSIFALLIVGCSSPIHKGTGAPGPVGGVGSVCGNDLATSIAAPPDLGNAPVAALPDLATVDLQPEKWKLTRSDEFDGPAGAIDGSKWSFDTGTGGNGWGNNELEYYTSRTDNVTLDGKGNLQIIARQESFMGSSYTSGRINTSGKFSQA